MLNDKALQAAYAAIPADKRDMGLIATAIRAYIDADDNIAAGREMLAALEQIEEMGIRNLDSARTCTTIAVNAMGAEAYRLADYSKDRWSK